MIEHPGDLLSAYLDGELGPADRGALARHLDGCPDCRAELDDVAAARRLLRGLPSLPLPDVVVERVVGAGRAWRRGVAAALVGAAASVLVVALATPEPAPVTPPVADLLTTHATAVSAGGEPVGHLLPAGFGP